MLRFLFLLGLLVWARPLLASAPVILVLGDSLSAAYGISLDQGWVALLQERLAGAGYPHQVVNASVSGDTTGGASARLPALLERHKPEMVIVELGGNDGLRGLPLDEIERNLDAISTACRDAGARVVLVRMRLPPNYGPAYTTGFEQIYDRVGARHGAALATFILEGIGDQAELMQGDGIHPAAAAQARMLDNVWPALVPLLQ